MYLGKPKSEALVADVIDALNCRRKDERCRTFAWGNCNTTVSPARRVP